MHNLLLLLNSAYFAISDILPFLGLLKTIFTEETAAFTMHLSFFFVSTLSKATIEPILDSYYLLLPHTDHKYPFSVIARTSLFILIKIVFAMWLYLPHTRGAHRIYKALIEKHVASVEDDVDEGIGRVYSALKGFITKVAFRAIRQGLIDSVLEIFRPITKATDSEGVKVKAPLSNARRSSTDLSNLDDVKVDPDLFLDVLDLGFCDGSEEGIGRVYSALKGFITKVAFRAIRQGLIDSVLEIFRPITKATDSEGVKVKAPLSNARRSSTDLSNLDDVKVDPDLFLDVLDLGLYVFENEDESGSQLQVFSFDEKSQQFTVGKASFGLVEITRVTSSGNNNLKIEIAQNSKKSSEFSLSLSDEIDCIILVTGLNQMMKIRNA